jgi:glycosyltransferase involved in cell wall biosynthesis
MRNSAHPHVLSVVVVTRGGPLLRETLDALRESASAVAGPVEVLVAFDGVPPRLPAAAEGVDRLTIKPLGLVHSGTSAARNAGWRAASSQLVLFLDEDVVPAPGLLAGHLAAHQASPGALVVGRVQELPDHLTAWGELDHVAVERRWRRMSESRPGPARVSMSNASMETRLLELTGGFAGWMPSEADIELGFRLQGAGVAVVTAPEAIGWRRSKRGFDEWRSLARTRGRLDAAIYRDGPDSGGAGSLAKSFRERHFLNRAAIRLAMAVPGLEQPLLQTAGWIGIAAHRARLKRLSRAGLSVVANLEYWSGVQQGLRGAEPFRRLLAGS